MATHSQLVESAASSQRGIGVLRLAATGGASMALIFGLCWIGTFVPFFTPTHAYIALFTPAEAQSIAALLEGSLWSLLFGIVTGAVFAWVYKLFSGLERWS